MTLFPSVAQSLCASTWLGQGAKVIFLTLVGRIFKAMKEIVNFPQCEETKSGKFIWNSQDSNYGMDIPVWTQKAYDIDCTNEFECDFYCEKYYKAEFVNGKRGKKCYSYLVLSGICLAISYDSVKDDWVFAGGCFKGNKTSIYEYAEINKKYDFSSIEIEVRNLVDPVIQAGIISNYSYDFGLGIIVFQY
jgi:hypothetical protein